MVATVDPRDTVHVLHLFILQSFAVKIARYALLFEVSRSKNWSR